MSTDVWRDPWIKNVTGFHPRVDPLPGLDGLWVANLINPSSTWNEDLVLGIFPPQEAEGIISIPLSCNRHADGWQWIYNQNGHYSVRSGYRQLQHPKVS